MDQVIYLSNTEVANSLQNIASDMSKKASTVDVKSLLSKAIDHGASQMRQANSLDQLGEDAYLMVPVLMSFVTLSIAVTCSSPFGASILCVG